MNLKQQIINATGRAKIKLIREFKALKPRDKIKVLREFKQLESGSLSSDLKEALLRIKEVLEVDLTEESVLGMENDVKMVSEAYEAIKDEPLVVEVEKLFEQAIEGQGVTLDSIGSLFDRGLA